MSKQILGLEIEADAISAILIKKEHKAIELLAQGYIPLAEEATGDDLSQAIQQLATQMEINGAVCMASLPAHLISFRNVQLPFTDTKKISQVLPYEMEATLPVAVDELIIDFEAHSVGGQNQLAQLLTASIEKQKLAFYLERLTANHIEPLMLTVSGYGVALWLAEQAESPNDFIFIHIKDDNATLFFVLSRKVNHIRSFSLRTQHTSRSECLFGKLKQTLIAFDEINDIPFNPQAVFLSEGHLLEPDFEQKTARWLNLTPNQVNIADAVHLDMDDKQRQAWEPAKFDSALALTLVTGKLHNHFNFRKGPFEIRKRWGEHKNRIITSAILLWFALLLAGANYLTDYNRIKRQIHAYDKQIDQIFYQVFPVGAKKTDKPSLQVERQLDQLKASLNSKAEPKRSMLTVDILNNISNAISPNRSVKLTNLVIGVDNTLISGTTDSHNSVNTIKNNLEKVKGFRRVTIVKSELNRTGEGVQFKLKIQL